MKMNDVATDQDLENALSDWLIGSLAQIESNFKDLVLAVTDYPRWYVAENGSFIHLPYMITYRFNELENLVIKKSVQWKQLEITAKHHPRFAKHLNSMINSGSMARSYSCVELCKKLLPAPVPEGQNIKIDTKLDVQLTIRNFIDDLNNENLKSITVWPISGARPASPIRLDANTEFRKLTADEKCHCLNFGMIQSQTSNTIDANSAQWSGLCYIEEMPKFAQSTSDRFEDFQQKFDAKATLLEDFMSLIPLYTKAMLHHCGGTSSAANLELGGIFASGVAGHGMGSQSIHFHFASQDPVISEADAPGLIELWKLLHGPHTGKYQKRVANAARRVNYSDTRRHPEDMIVDCMIAAESLYLDDEKNELSFRLSVNAAMWASDNNLERKKIFQLFKNAYTLRSKVVHGGSVNVSEVRSIIEPLKKSLRDGILKALNHVGEQNGYPNWNGMMFPQNVL